MVGSTCGHRMCGIDGRTERREQAMIESTRTSLATGIGNRVFYGWMMVFVAAMGLFASGPGQSHTFSVFNQLIAEDLGLSLTDVSWAYGIATTAAAFALPLMGRQVDRFGARRSLIGITILLGLACFFFGMLLDLM